MSTTDVRGGRTAPPSVASRRAGRRRPTSDGWWPVLFIGPLMLGVAIFYYWPLVHNVIASFQQTNAFGGDPEWVGLANYEALFVRPDLWSAMANTLLYIAVVLLGIPLSVAIAAMIELPGLAGRGFYRTLYFMPYLAMPMAVSQVWKLVFNGSFGLLNQTLGAIGVDNPPMWLVSPRWLILTVALFGLWASIGFNVIILSAGLKSIPPELYEAAEIDGASKAAQFRSITVPLLTPSIFFLTVMTTIGGFQLFDALFAMMGGANPAEPSSRSLVFLFYKEAFVNHDVGAGAAVALFIFALVAIVTALQFMVQRKWVNYV